MEIPDKEDDDEHINEKIDDEEDDEPYETIASAQHQYTLSEEDAQDPEEEGCSREKTRFGRRRRRTRNKVEEERRKQNIRQLNLE